MKKIVSVLLVSLIIACAILPTSALADTSVDLARSAKNLIDTVRGREVTEYAYSNVLGLLIVSIAERDFQTQQAIMTLMGGLIEVGAGDMLSSFSDVWSVGKLGSDFYIEIIRDAEKCYESGEYNFDVLEKYVDILLSVEQ